MLGQHAEAVLPALPAGLFSGVFSSQVAEHGSGLMQRCRKGKKHLYWVMGVSTLTIK